MTNENANDKARKARPKASRPVKPTSERAATPVPNDGGVVRPRFLADAPRQPPTADAWMLFAGELGNALRGLEEGEWLVLSLKSRRRFVQFMNQGGAGYRAEAVSDFYLTDADRLTERDRATLLELGWGAPTNLPDEFGFRPDGSPNYFVCLANPVPLDELCRAGGEHAGARLRGRAPELARILDGERRQGVDPVPESRHSASARRMMPATWSGFPN